MTDYLAQGSRDKKNCAINSSHQATRIKLPDISLTFQTGKSENSRRCE